MKNFINSEKKFKMKISCRLLIFSWWFLEIEKEGKYLLVFHMKIVQRDKGISLQKKMTRSNGS